MATITLSDSASQEGPVRFVFGNVDFLLEKGDKYETDDSSTIAAAQGSPYLSVEVPVETSEADFAYDANDPHFNPSIDHLSPMASPEAKAAADAAEAATLAKAFPADPRYNPEVAPEEAKPVQPASAPLAGPASVEPETSTEGASA